MFTIKNSLKNDYQKYVQFNSKNKYSKQVVDFSESLGTALEIAINKGEIFSEIVENIIQKTNKNNITGFMYNAAVQALIHFWIHGEQLRRWHNKEYGIEGTVNPAIVSI